MVDYFSGGVNRVNSFKLFLHRVNTKILTPAVKENNVNGEQPVILP